METLLIEDGICETENIHIWLAKDTVQNQETEYVVSNKEYWTVMYFPSSYMAINAGRSPH